VIFNKDDIHRMLIDSAHSKDDAKNFFRDNLNEYELLSILLDVAVEDDSNDARMEAAYWAKQFDVKLLSQFEGVLLQLQGDVLDSVACPAMVALGRIKSVEGLKSLISDRIAPELYWEAEALRYYLDLE
jgi:hypothetical protein